MGEPWNGERKGFGATSWSGSGVGAALGALRTSWDSSWAWDTVSLGRGVFLFGM